jgi:metal transporter CNNM
MEVVVTLIVIVFLIALSAVCSGLNVAFMSLNVADLRRKSKLGNGYARRLLPLRKNAHLTLAAILLTNVAAASASPLVLQNKLNGIVAGALSTLLLVIFAEIMPQALFARNALAFCGALAPFMQAMIIATYPVAKPLQLLLDRLFGRAKSELHSRHELGILISEHLGHKESELDEDEVEIIRNALQLSEKRVRDIMVPLEKTYRFTPDTILDGPKIDELKAIGHSRIPIMNRKHTICYGVLLTKDLIDVNFDDRGYRVDEFDLYPTQLVGGMTALDTMFRKFIAAGTHLICIEKDDTIIGIVTIEDLLEEIVGHQIEDETDRRRRRRFRHKPKQL